MANLANLCHDKAEHARTNWQDEPLAKAWDRNGKLIMAVNVEDL